MNAFTLRTSVNETTEETPVLLMFGQDPKLHLDLIVGKPTLGLRPTTIDLVKINEFKTNLIRNYDLLRTLCANILKLKN